MRSGVKPGSSGPGRFSFITLGCKSNQYDSAAMAADLTRAGLKNGEPADADIVIVNTCMVTASAEAQCRKAVRQARRENADARLVVSGCMSRGKHDLSESLPEADLILDPGNKGQLVDLLGLRHGSAGDGTWSDWPDDPAVVFTLRDRALLKIQDGCNASCSYCIVPAVRGRSRSLNPEKVLEAVRSLMASGYLEVVLSGIHLGQYGHDLDRVVVLEELLELLVNDRLPGRVRLSSIEPLEVTGKMVEVIRSSGGTVCRHVHVPIQSGSDRILGEMGRPYTRTEMVNALVSLMRGIPGIGLGCDVICGFPGETEDDFDLTEEIIADLKLPFVHAFPFSPRPGTRASRLKDDVPHHKKKERVKRLRTLADRNRTGFALQQVGRQLTVALETGKKTGHIMWGLADNYLRVKVKGCIGSRSGDLAEVLITGAGEGVLVGKPIGRNE